MRIFAQAKKNSLLFSLLFDTRHSAVSVLKASLQMVLSSSQKEPTLSEHSRRDFLRSAGLAGTFALTQAGMADAQTEGSRKPPPEPIARLKSRKAEAKAIAVEERQQRIDQARQLMAQNNLDAIVTIGGSS